MFPFHNSSGGTSDFVRLSVVSWSWAALQTGHTLCLAGLAVVNMPAAAIQSLVPISTAATITGSGTSSPS